MNNLREKMNHIKSLAGESGAVLIATAFVLMFIATGCQTQRQLSSIQRGMTKAEVRSAFGEPDDIESGATNGSDLVSHWYYAGYATQHYRERVWGPSMRVHPGEDYHATLEKVDTSRGVRYWKFEIVFVDGAVFQFTEFQPPRF